MRQLLLIWTFLNLGSNICFSQQMDTFILKDFEVRSLAGSSRNIGTTKLNLNTGKYNTLTDALQNQSALFIKQYGTGGLATAGMRGMGAHHTAVMWNGININSSMNSNVDFNLIPLFLVDQANVETGASSATCGNGAIAGAIYLSNATEKETMGFANLQAGSFGYYQAGVGAGFSIGKLRLKTRLLYRKSENDILYYNKFVNYAPLERQQNSAYEQKGFLQEMGLDFGKNHSLKIDAWFLETSRELPATMGGNKLNLSSQYDMNSRMVVTHQFKGGNRLYVNNKLAILYDQLNFHQTYYSTAYNSSKSLIGESEWLFKVNKNNRIINSINTNYSTAKTDGYPDGPSRNMLSYWLNYEWRNTKENLLLSIGNRALFVNRQMVPLSPDASIQFSPFSKLKIKANAAYSYRVPSFNDYYWRPGGNPNLEPERGFKQELSFEVKQKKLKMVATGFHHMVKNWIMWVDNGSGIWKAQNALEVSSSGIEVSGDYSQMLGRHFIQLIGRYQFVKSIHSKVYAVDENYLGKQLPYTPNHTAVATFNYKYGGLFFYVTELFNGSRFTSSDNSPQQVLPAYFITNASIGYQFDYRKQLVLLGFTANNLFNFNYQVMENRPMPLVNYQFTLKYSIKNEK